ncbi:TPA: SDR family oxidoreductase [Escherichia coli]
MKKVIVVTGCNSGLGKSIFDTLGAYGHEVVGIDLDNGYDIRNAKQMKELLSQYDVEGLINCAGVNSNNWFEDVNYEEFNRVMHTNAFSFVNTTQAALKSLINNKGFVINIVSNAAHIPMTSSLCYNASKAAALMISKQMAHELTPKYGITVFSISPNKLRGTGMSKQIEDAVCATRGWTPEYAAEYQKKALMNGLETEPQVIADFIRHILITGAWRFMSGTDIPFGK